MKKFITASEANDVLSKYGYGPISSLKKALREFRDSGRQGRIGNWNIDDRVQNPDPGEVTFSLTHSHYILADYRGGKLYNLGFQPQVFEEVAKAVKSVFPGTRY